MKKRFATRTVKWKLFLFSFLLFQLFFAFLSIRYYGVIIIEPRIKFVSREYWDWFMTTPPFVPYEGQLITLVEGASDLFLTLFWVEEIYLIYQNRKTPHIARKTVALYAAALCALTGLVHVARVHLLHYRLFMNLIPCEILSLVLLVLLLYDRKLSVNSDTYL
ncbi:MAG: hypothetical protein VB071_15375 [Lawsonibacter sp.]|nr:hypothetical protein [Lawsonibacter sp.]